MYDIGKDIDTLINKIDLKTEVEERNRQMSSATAELHL